jgi:hypothetical protein
MAKNLRLGWAAEFEYSTGTREIIRIRGNCSCSSSSWGISKTVWWNRNYLFWFRFKLSRKVSVTVPDSDPDHILQFLKLKFFCTKSCLFKLEAALLSRKLKYFCIFFTLSFHFIRIWSKSGSGIRLGTGMHSGSESGSAQGKSKSLFKPYLK